MIQTRPFFTRDRRDNSTEMYLVVDGAEIPVEEDEAWALVFEMVEALRQKKFIEDNIP